MVEKLKTPFFSIVIPTYNRASFLPKAIESVLEQTFKDWELIIVNDGSTDKTEALVEQYVQRDNRIRYIYQENAERSAARNKGIGLVHGEYIVFLDSDDYFLSRRLENIYNIIRYNPRVAVYYTSFQHEIDNELVQYDKKALSQVNIYNELLFYMLHSQQCIIHRKILEEYKFNIDLSIGEDLELWLRIARHYPFVYIENEPSIVIVEHSGRSVGIDKLNTYQKHFFTLLYIEKSNHSIKKEILNTAMHGVLMSILRCHFSENNKKEFLIIFFQSFYYCRTESFKEKIYMFIKLFF